MIERVLGRVFLPICLLAICLGLSSCGDYPEPFLGNPGATARRLAKPPAPLLAVAPGSDTLLSDQANQDLAKQLATALQAVEVPAMVRTPKKSDWKLITKATETGNTVQPEFSVISPEGKEEGKAVGEPIPTAEWAKAPPALMQQVAAEAAPRIGAVLTSIRIAHEKADPNSLYNRAARVMVAEVTGAPGDGDDALTKQMRARLAVLGPVVLTTPTSADFIVKGTVAVVPIADHKERVEIQWSVQNPAGQERGRVVQLNEIPAGTLDHYWGDIAVVVATEASNGVNDVIKRQSDREPDPADAANGTAGGSAGAATPGAAAQGASQGVAQGTAAGVGGQPVTNIAATAADPSVTGPARSSAATGGPVQAKTAAPRHEHHVATKPGAVHHRSVETPHGTARSSEHATHGKTAEKEAHGKATGNHATKKKTTTTP
ncbi:MAG TPA: hypothetical protein VHB27_01480 [Rhodopila sp.]|uniref:hypothetical protein n=1 Tax=Rhodopila sp. TaxID=2480087 RepID=UPI002B8EAF80|nr:hypothetical protein [Rhodopila sp.]HVY13869.1 hypothetical protein [Rhodopila sp.]